MSNRVTETEVILIGAGIMSATLGTLLKELVPEWDITVFEKLDKAGKRVPMYGIMQVQGILHYVSLTIHPKNRMDQWILVKRLK